MGHFDAESILKGGGVGAIQGEDFFKYLNVALGIHKAITFTLTPSSSLPHQGLDRPFWRRLGLYPDTLR